MSAHPSPWHPQSRLLSVSLYLLPSHSHGYAVQNSRALSLPNFSDSIPLARFLSGLLFTPLKSLTSLSLLIPFTCYSPSFFSPWHSHSCVPEQSRAGGMQLILQWVCVCVFYIKNNQMLRMWLPFKNLYTKLLFLAEQSTFKSWNQLTFFSSAHVTSTVVFISWPIITKTEVCNFLFKKKRRSR